MTDGNNRDEGENTQDQVKDPEEYVNKRRLKSIFDIRDNIAQKRLEVKQADQIQGASRFKALTAYRTLVDSYVLEVEPLLLSYDPGQKYLYEFDFGEVNISPETRSEEGLRGGTSTCGKEIRIQGNPHRSWFRLVREPEPAKVEVKGLDALFSLPDPLYHEFEVQVVGSGRQTTTKTVPVTMQIDYPILDSMVRVVNQFLAQIGFELEPEKDETPAQLEL